MSTKLRTLLKRRMEIERELAVLASFRQTSQLQQFKRRLIGEHSYVKRQIALLQEDSASKTKLQQEKVQRANQNRSEKMKRTWRYLRSIQENYFPDKGLRELRSLYKKQREGLETDVPDVAWRNPSP